jgi:ABC-type phosphate transport system substrate-binding protein
MSNLTLRASCQCAALALGLLVSVIPPVYAHSPTTVPDIQVFLAGSSSMQKAIGALVASVCQSGTLDVYYDSASNGKQQRAYFCSVNGAALGAPALAGKRVLFYHRATGGSWWGVAPIARALPLQRLQVNVNCAATGNASPSYVCPDIVNAIPDVGVSDEEPVLFGGVNVPPPETPLSASELAHLTVFSPAAELFAVAVTANVAATNLNKADVTSLLTGTALDWSAVLLNEAPADVFICRRAPGSGTQAFSNAYFLHNPCGGGLSPLSATDSPTVTEAVTSGDVVQCLNNHYAAGRKAIGILSLENQPQAADHYKFVNVDGVGATEMNAVCGTNCGDYDLYSEPTFQYRNTTVAGVLAPTAALKTFIDAFIAHAGDPGVLAGITGLVASPINYVPSSYATGWVMNSSRLGDMCAPSQKFYSCPP